MRISNRSAVIALFVAISSVTAARGDSLLVGNLSAAPASSDTIDADDARAQGFMTGGRDWNLTSIEAVLGGLGTGTFAASATLVASTTNTFGEKVPDLATPLATFTFPTVDTSFSTVSFAPTTSFILKANTNYWFVLQATLANAALFDWQYTSSTVVDPGSEGSLTSAAATIPPGSGTWRSQANQPYLIGINGTPVVAVVPEPSSWILSGIGVSCVYALIRRRTAAIAG